MKQRGAYYNEFDEHKALWLKELMKRGIIAEGDIDTRSIELVSPADVAGYERVHWFAGVGIWDYALTLAGWTGPVWTASCPCQPFSAAGKRKGAEDSRHLWPVLARLIRVGRPPVVFGEQVSSADGLAWFGNVRLDLEAARYRAWALDTCAAGVGAPHIRQRLYWAARLADVQHPERQPEHQEHAEAYGRHRPGRGGTVGGLADDSGARLEERCGEPGDAGRQRAATDGDCGAVRVGDVPSAGPLPGAHVRVHRGEDGRGPRDAEPQGPTNGAWAGADWVLTRPQRVGDAPSLRPVGAGIFPLAHGAPARVVRLRGYGDGIVGPQAAAFIQACAEEWGIK